MATIKVGDKVIWRGGFGRDKAATATVTGIEKCEAGEKYGVPVESVSIKIKDRCVFDLDNGHWCYGDQIDGLA